MDFNEVFNQLEEYINGIKSKFINAHLENSLASPDEYDLDVKSYCILCHAAFEEFVEIISLQVMSKCIKRYLTESRVSKPLITLMHFKGNYSNYLEKDLEPTVEKVFDYNRRILNDLKATFSQEIFNNHGVSSKYLRKLLMPVSIDIPENVNWTNSLEKLANARGAYAHKFLEQGRVQQSLEPEEANTIVSDCLEMCKELKNRAITVLA
ncbi:HEPN domain-containing protein [Adhaeribacter radiodurans]|uniref:RiboL-PSP-HEPN domain-containing protein n=1 Tax=Adhaeribacter radiodurans TaxID=2745197 RepID=A0A7L7LCS9_9BACT|nr:HEPN domain-containing protein [Adhaeribacter radiodurans]QMU30583.1 hypothetical protein HUW48_22280 [Adhaeribacter radiodurans]